MSAKNAVRGKHLYMHLLDGQPAEYHEDYGAPRICFAGKCVSKLATSLRQIRREQLRVIAQDNRDGIGGWKYSYTRISRRALNGPAQHSSAGRET